MDVLALVLRRDADPRQTRRVQHQLALGLGDLPLHPGELHVAEQLGQQRVLVAREHLGQLCGHPLRIGDGLGPGIQPVADDRQPLAEPTPQHRRPQRLALRRRQPLLQAHLIVPTLEPHQECLAVDVQQLAQPLGHRRLVLDLAGACVDRRRLRRKSQLATGRVVDRPPTHRQRHERVVLAVRLRAIPVRVLALDPAQPTEQPAEDAEDDHRRHPHPAFLCSVPLHRVPSRAGTARPR